MLTLLYGNTGTGKTNKMLEELADKVSAGKKCFVLVPEQFMFETEQMLYNHLGAQLSNTDDLEVVSFSRLTRRIFSELKPPEGSAADSTAKLAVMHNVIKSAAAGDGLPYFKKQLDRPSFLTTIMTMLSELMHSGITPEILAGIAENAPDEMKSKLTDICTIYTLYSKRLGELDMRDTMDDTRLAAGIAASVFLDTDSRKRFFDGSFVFMDEFKSFTGDQYDMIRTMLSQCAELTICLTTNTETAGSVTPFAAICDTMGILKRIALDECGEAARTVLLTENTRFKDNALLHLSRSLTSDISAPFNEKADSVTVFSAQDIYGECDYICAKIRELIDKDDTYSYSDIAVLSREMNKDISILSAYFDRYNIPYYCDKKTSAGHKRLILMINSALELAASEKMSTETVLRYAKTGLLNYEADKDFIKDGETVTKKIYRSISSREIAELENYCTEWEIDGDIWEKDFPDLRINKTRQRILEPVLRLRSSCTDKTGGEICTAVRQLILDTRAEDILLKSYRFYNEDEAAEEKTGEKNDSAAQLEEVRDNSRVCEEVNNILLSLEKALPDKISLKEFKDIFTLAANNISLASPPIYLNNVKAQQSDLARLADTKIVFVMHANDGVFPMISSGSLTFSDKERDYFKALDHDLSGSIKKRISEERFNAYKALSSASEKLFVSYSERTVSEKSLAPSSFIEKIISAVPMCSVISWKDIDDVFYCRTPQAAYMAAMRKDDVTDKFYATVKQYLMQQDKYRARFEYLEKAKNSMTYKHTISGKTANGTDITDKIFFGSSKTLSISPTSFETFIGCPFKFLCRYGLSIKAVEKKTLAANSMGDAVHNCMHRILADYFGSSPKVNDNGEPYTKNDFIKLTAEELSEKISSIFDEFFEDRLEKPFALSYSSDVYLRTLKKNTLRALQKLQQEVTESKFIPTAFEENIGNNEIDSSVTPLIFPCSNGYSVKLRGTADRVDTYTDETDNQKYIRIIDYKTGQKDYSALEICNGMNLQMYQYLFWLTDKENGKYKDCKPAGVLYSLIHSVDPAKIGKNCSNIPALVEKSVLESLRTEGAVLHNPDDDYKLLKAMEDISGKKTCKYIPVKFDKDGLITKASMIDNIISDNDIEAIRKKSDELIINMCENVQKGNFHANPLQLASPCKYCDYRELCLSAEPKTKPADTELFNEKKSTAEDMSEAEKSAMDAQKQEAAKAEKEAKKRKSAKKQA